MIIPILIFITLNFASKWFIKKYLKVTINEYNWSFPFTKLFGLFLSFILSILILLLSSNTSFFEIFYKLKINFISIFEYLILKQEPVHKAIVFNTNNNFFLSMAYNLMTICILNLLPLPGFSFGNFIVSLIETIRKKMFDKKLQRLIEIISISLIIILLLR